MKLKIKDPRFRRTCGRGVNADKAKWQAESFLSWARMKSKTAYVGKENKWNKIANRSLAVFCVRVSAERLNWQLLHVLGATLEGCSGIYYPTAHFEGIVLTTSDSLALKLTYIKRRPTKILGAREKIE